MHCDCQRAPRLRALQHVLPRSLHRKKEGGGDLSNTGQARGGVQEAKWGQGEADMKSAGDEQQRGGMRSSKLEEEKEYNE